MEPVFDLSPPSVNGGTSVKDLDISFSS